MINSRLDLTELPRLKAWLGDDGRRSIWDFLAAEGGGELAVAFLALYWPEFVEVDGCVLLRERYEPSNFQEWNEKLGGDPSRVEEIINHVHLWDLFEFDDTTVPEKAIEHLGQVLALTWHCALQHQFPDRAFDIRFVLDDSEYGPTISFHTVR